MAILDVRNLVVDIPTEDGIVHAVRDVSFSIRPGTLFGIAGESGSGKSVMTQAIMGLVPNADIRGQALFEGRNLIGLPNRDMRRLRGGKIAMIFQDPLSSLHPYYTIGAQIAEAQAAMPTGPVTHGKAWIEMVHRYLATTVGVLIIAMTIMAWRRARRQGRAGGAQGVEGARRGAMSPWWPCLLYTSPSPRD